MPRYVGKRKNKRLADNISIRSPTAFKQSITALRKGRYSSIERRALVLAQARAKLQLKRKNLSAKERMQMKKIASTKIPKVKK